MSLTQQSKHDLETMVEIARFIVAGRPITDEAFLRPDVLRLALARTILELWEPKKELPPLASPDRENKIRQD